MKNKYIIRRAVSIDESSKINQLFTEIFKPEAVGELAEVFFRSLPGTKPDYWFLAEDTTSSELVSGLTLIPWHWKIKNIDLKVAEMGIVGTKKAHTKQGLIKGLNRDFEKELINEEYDLSVIQGIPGFYHKLGYYYAVEFENHINLSLHIINEKFDLPEYTIKKATLQDIDFLMSEDKKNAEKYFISAERSKDHWKFIFTEGKKTEYTSEIYILENNTNQEKYYFRVNLHGFGEGLILSEVSVNITYSSMQKILFHCKELSMQRKKPYIRVNLSQLSKGAKIAVSLGAHIASTYAWQIKIVNPLKFLKKIKTILEERLADSVFSDFSESLTIDLYTSKINILFENGKVSEINDSEVETNNIFSISSDLLPPLLLGHRSYQELQDIRPDLFFWEQKSGLLLDTLFPKTESWAYCQY